VTQAHHKIKVLVVDDSAVSRAFLAHALQTDPALEVVGCAQSGAEAIAQLERKKPDVVTMDIHMPGMDGFEATRQIMETQPLPIVIVSASFDPVDVEKTFRAMQAGAVAAVAKPPGEKDPKYETSLAKLIGTVKAMAEVRVIKRWTKDRMAARQAPPVPARKSADDIRLVAIGASTGGPPVLQAVLTGLPKPFPVPVVIVQHISTGFVQGLADWLNATTGMRVSLAQHGELAAPGCAYLAPDDVQLRIGSDGRLCCVPEPAEHGLRPAVSFLFRSVAQHFGPHAAGVLLTGMGYDGAEELQLMRKAGAVTIAQDAESSVVHGMPGEAIRLGAAMHVCNPERIAAVLRSLVSPGSRRPSVHTP
jgi:two-component system chemotaxis response regulator CheB